MVGFNYTINIFFRISKCQAIEVAATKNPMHSSQDRTPSYSQTKPFQDSITNRSVDNNVEERSNERNICSFKESSRHVPLCAVPDKLKSKVVKINEVPKYT